MSREKIDRAGKQGIMKSGVLTMTKCAKVTTRTQEETDRDFQKFVRARFNVTPKQFVEKFQAGEYDQDDCYTREALMFLPYTSFPAKYGKR